MCTTYTWLAYSWPDRPVPARVCSDRLQTRADSMAVTSSARGRTPAHVPGTSRRCGSRHWVGLAIVAIQMAAWCVVGALLIHRGVSNLRRQEVLRNEAMYRARANPKPTEPSIVDRFRPNNEKVPVLHKGFPLPPPAPNAVPAGRARATGAASGVTSSGVDNGASFDDTTPSPAEDDDVVFPERSYDRRTTKWSYFPQNDPLRPLIQRGRGADSEGADSEGAVPTPDPGARNVATGGAATAVVMVTVGGVMLVVGPAFLLIKIVDVYQRQRRFNKLAQREDPPPSYEEVTEKAPRYSALFQVADNGELTPLSPPILPVTPDPNRATDSVTAATPLNPSGTESASMPEDP